MFQSKHFNPSKSSKLFLLEVTDVPSFRKKTWKRTKQEGMSSFIDNVCSKNDELCVFLLKRFIWNDAELTWQIFFLWRKHGIKQIFFVQSGLSYIRCIEEETNRGWKFLKITKFCVDHKQRVTIFLNLYMNIYIINERH